MKSTIDRVEGLSRKVNIEIPVEYVRDAFEKVYKEIRKNATIKGFRKGKAPMNVIRSNYSDVVQRDVISDLINDGYQHAINEHSLDPVGSPKIHYHKFSADDAFSFTAELEVRPEIQLKTFEGLAVDREILEVDEEKINQTLESIRQARAETVTVFEDRALASGDIAEVDFAGFVNGEPLEKGTATGYLIEIGSQRAIPGFEEGLVGMKPSERRELNLTFPSDYHEASIAGKPVRFDITLKSIKKKVLPELSDEFAARVEPGKTLQQLKDAISQEMKESEEKRIAGDVKMRLLKALVKENPIPVPNVLLQRQKEMMLEDMSKRMRQQGLNEEQYQEYVRRWDEDLNQTARFTVQSTFLLDALADKLNLRASEADIEEKLLEYSRQTGLELAKLRAFYGEGERQARLAFQITEDRVVAHLLEKAKVREVPKSQLADNA